MIRLLVKEIILYDDKIEIYYNMSDKKRPDEETHRAFSFYKENFTYDNRAWWFNHKKGGTTEIEVVLKM